MCLADPANATANGTRLELWKCEGWNEEKFAFAANGTIQIHGKCVYVNPSNIKGGAGVVLEACSGSNAGERWEFERLSTFDSMLVNAGNNNEFGVEGNTASNGAAVGTYESNGTVGFSWRPV